MAKRLIFHTSTRTGKKTHLATFELVKGKVVSEYTPEAGELKKDLESGLVLSDGKPVTPKDGKAFYDGLLHVFSQSTIMAVEDK